jgi:hypothetical protein
VESGDTATTRRKDEITRGDLKRTSPNHVELPVEKLRDPVNRAMIFCAAGVLSATPLTYSLRRDDSWQNALKTAGDPSASFKTNANVSPRRRTGPNRRATIQPRIWSQSAKVFRRRSSRTFPHAPRSASENFHTIPRPGRVLRLFSADADTSLKRQGARRRGGRP